MSIGIHVDHETLRLAVNRYSNKPSDRHMTFWVDPTEAEDPLAFRGPMPSLSSDLLAPYIFEKSKTSSYPVAPGIHLGNPDPSFNRV